MYALFGGCLFALIHCTGADSRVPFYPASSLLDADHRRAMNSPDTLLLRPAGVTAIGTYRYQQGEAPFSVSADGERLLVDAGGLVFQLETSASKWRTSATSTPITFYGAYSTRTRGPVEECVLRGTVLSVSESSERPDTANLARLAEEIAEDGQLFAKDGSKVLLNICDGYSGYITLAGARTPFELVVDIEQVGIETAPVARLQVLDRTVTNDMPTSMQPVQQEHDYSALRPPVDISAQPAGLTLFAGPTEGLIEVALFLDTAFVDTCHGGDAVQAERKAVNVMARADEILDLVNMHVAITSITIFSRRTGGQPFQASSNTGEYLTNFRNWALANFRSNNVDTVHLLTCSSNGGGIACVDCLCFNFGLRFGYGLTVYDNDRRTDASEINTAGAVAAHEIGHNFGLRHDDNTWGTTADNLDLCLSTFDTSTCPCDRAPSCSDPFRCFMQSSSHIERITQWSLCSHRYVRERFFADESRSSCVAVAQCPPAQLFNRPLPSSPLTFEACRTFSREVFSDALAANEGTYSVTALSASNGFSLANSASVRLRLTTQRAPDAGEPTLTLRGTIVGRVAATADCAAVFDSLSVDVRLTCSETPPPPPPTCPPAQLFNRPLPSSPLTFEACRTFSREVFSDALASNQGTYSVTTQSQANGFSLANSASVRLRLATQRAPDAGEPTLTLRGTIVGQVAATADCAAVFDSLTVDVRLICSESQPPPDICPTGWNDLPNTYYAFCDNVDIVEASLENCRRDCLADAACHAITYRDGWCWLKTEAALGEAIGAGQGWFSAEKCAAPPSNELRVRLVDGFAASNGRVEVQTQVGGPWGTICDDGWEDADARVVCRMLGYSGEASAYGGARFGEGTALIALDDVQCQGLEESLSECTFLTEHNCAHSEDAGVSCRGDFEWQVRLVGGTTPSEGRVEVQTLEGGPFGTVCDDSWRDVDARVVCRMLGFSDTTEASAFGNARFGEGSGEILLDDVQCQGSETTLSACEHSKRHNCAHSEDAGVSCGGACPSGFIVHDNSFYAANNDVDIRQLTASFDVDACAQLCLRNDACRGFTHNGNFCWLKNANHGAEHPAEGWVAARKC